MLNGCRVRLALLLSRSAGGAPAGEADYPGDAARAAVRQAKQQERAGLAEWDELTGSGTMSTEGQLAKSELELNLT